MSFAELTDQHVELLPDRTVMSLMRADTGGLGLGGESGEPGTDGANGKSIPGTGWMQDLQRLFAQPDLNSSHTTHGIGNATSTTR